MVGITCTNRAMLKITLQKRNLNLAVAYAAKVLEATGAIVQRTVRTNELPNIPKRFVPL